MTQRAISLRSLVATVIMLLLLAVAISAMSAEIHPSVTAETLFQSYPGNNTALVRGSRVIMLLPQDAEMHHVDTSEGYPHLSSGSCVAAPPAKCQLAPGQVEPMREAPQK